MPGIDIDMPDARTLLLVLLRHIPLAHALGLPKKREAFASWS